MSSTKHAGKPKHRRRNLWQDMPEIATIDSKIQNISVNGALCDLGTSINIMPMTIQEDRLSLTATPKRHSSIADRFNYPPAEGEVVPHTCVDPHHLHKFNNTLRKRRC